METWVDVQVLENLYGVTDALRTEILSDPKVFYRVVYPEGPAQKPKNPAAAPAVFKQVGNEEAVDLPPITFQGSLRVAGNNNVVRGTTLNETSFTIIAGDLIIAGNNNKVSKLTVLGKVILQGNDNELKEVDYDGGIQELGKGNNKY
jgi:hypothetical protein